MPTHNHHMPNQANKTSEEGDEVKFQEENLVIPVVEEKAVIGKKVVETQRVRLIKTVEEHEEIVTVPLIEDEVNVVRKPINQYVDKIPEVRVEDHTTIYPVMKEVLVVEKKLMLVEEIHVTNRQQTTIANETINLRTESIEIDRETLE